MIGYLQRPVTAASSIAETRCSMERIFGELPAVCEQRSPRIDSG